MLGHFLYRQHLVGSAGLLVCLSYYWSYIPMANTKADLNKSDHGKNWCKVRRNLYLSRQPPWIVDISRPTWKINRFLRAGYSGSFCACLKSYHGTVWPNAFYVVPLSVWLAQHHPSSCFFGEKYSVLGLKQIKSISSDYKFDAKELERWSGNGKWKLYFTGQSDLCWSENTKRLEAHLCATVSSL